MNSRGYLLTLTLTFFSFIILNAQVTIGAMLDPDPDALLDMKNSTGGLANKALLLPRVRLSNISSPQPLTAHVEGMLVYNITDNATIKAGLHYNNGSEWVNIDPLSGGQANQALMSGTDLQPTWGTLDLPDESSIGYVLNKFDVSNSPTGAIFTGDMGYAVTAQDRPYNSSEWFKFSMSTPFSVTPLHTKNRLIVTMQAMIQTNHQATQPDWIDYAGGVFINDILKVVKLGQFSHTGTYAFEVMTIYLIVEDLPVNVAQEISIAVTRLASSSGQDGRSEQIGIGTPVQGVTNLNAFMAKPFIAIQYYEDPSSPTN